MRAYRFTAVLRHVLSALYGILLGYAIMDGNRTVNFFVIFLTVIFAYISIKSLCGRFLVKIKLEAPENDLVRDKPSLATARIRNYTPFFFPVSYFLVKDSLNPDGQRIFFFLRPFAKLTKEFSFTVDHCGIYPLKASMLRLSSAGGMIWVRAFIGKKNVSSVSVIPEICPATVAPESAEGTGGTVTAQKFSQSPTDSVFLRQYQPGDDPRYIHWKRSAAREDWLLKGFYREGERKFVVLLDARLPGGLSRNKVGDKEPFMPGDDEAELYKADRVCAAATAICASLFVDETPFTFVCPDPDAIGDEPSLDAVPCESSVDLLKARRLAGTVDFLPSEANPVEDAKLPSYVRTALSAGDESLTIIRVSAKSALGKTVESGFLKKIAALLAREKEGKDGSDPAAFPYESDDVNETSGTAGDGMISREASGPYSSSGGSDRRRRLGNISIEGFRDTEFYGEEFPGAYLISAEVNV